MMRDDRDVDAEFYLGAPKNERERERSAHTDERATVRTEEPVAIRAHDTVGSSTASPAQITDASLRYGIVEEADDDLGEGLYERHAA